jgi:hypothetical protein
MCRKLLVRHEWHVKIVKIKPFKTNLQVSGGGFFFFFGSLSARLDSVDIWLNTGCMYSYSFDMIISRLEHSSQSFA